MGEGSTGRDEPRLEEGGTLWEGCIMHVVDL
jgi:hypothetical protein